LIGGSDTNFVVDEGRINILYSCSHVTTIPFSIDRDWHDRKDNSNNPLIWKMINLESD
jgi:hypothetical protein